MVTALPHGRPAALAMEGGPGQRAATEPPWPEQPDCSPELKLSARSLAGAVGRRSVPPTPHSSHNSLLVRAVVLLCLAGALQVQYSRHSLLIFDLFAGNSSERLDKRGYQHNREKVSQKDV